MSSQNTYTYIYLCTLMYTYVHCYCHKIHFSEGRYIHAIKLCRSLNQSQHRSRDCASIPIFTLSHSDIGITKAGRHPTIQHPTQLSLNYFNSQHNSNTLPRIRCWIWLVFRSRVFSVTTYLESAPRGWGVGWGGGGVGEEIGGLLEADRKELKDAGGEGDWWVRWGEMRRGENSLPLIPKT